MPAISGLKTGWSKLIYAGMECLSQHSGEPKNQLRDPLILNYRWTGGYLMNSTVRKFRLILIANQHLIGILVFLDGCDLFTHLFQSVCLGFQN